MLNGQFIQNEQVDKAVPFHDPLKRLKLTKTLASDGVIKKDNVKTIALLAYYVLNQLYMLHPLISALILKTVNH